MELCASSSQHSPQPLKDEGGKGSGVVEEGWWVGDHNGGYILMKPPQVVYNGRIVGKEGRYFLQKDRTDKLIPSYLA